jgi:DNA-directed RNA polymerase specialized sigma24 family protein
MNTVSPILIDPHALASDPASIRYALRIARKNTYLPYDDPDHIDSCALFGLWTAALNYTGDVPFLAFASSRIKGAIADSRRKEGRRKAIHAVPFSVIDHRLRLHGEDDPLAFVVDPSGSPSESVDSYDFVVQTIRHLPPYWRLILSLFYLEACGGTPDRVAGVVHRHPSAVIQTRRKAIEFIRQHGMVGRVVEPVAHQDRS